MTEFVNEHISGASLHSAQAVGDDDGQLVLIGDTRQHRNTSFRPGRYGSHIREVVAIPSPRVSTSRGIACRSEPQ